MSKISRWFNSKTGKRTIAGVLALTLVVAIIGQLANWWDFIPPSGTVIIVPPAEPFPAPKGGYTCLPTCDEKDAKFFYIANQGMATFSGEKIVVWIGVPADYTSFELGIFDGDSGRDNNGNVNWRGGNWDNMENEAIYRLYADPLKDGQGTTLVGEWSGNQSGMPNNAWYNITLNTGIDAKAPSSHYFYRLEVSQQIQVVGGNAFKLRSTGYLVTGKSGVATVSVPLIGMIATASTPTSDMRILHPQYQSMSNPGPSTYVGEWEVYFYVPNDMVTMELWDGDFDRGPSASVAPDTDDPNTTGKPEWATSPYVRNEQAWGKGAPADDAASIIYRRGPSVKYEIIDPVGAPLYTNDEPSGSEEWERFVISTDPNVASDMVVPDIKEGFYIWHIEGLDLHNVVFLRTDFEMCDPEDGCGPVEWPEGNCPRTIGYWKNNVSKVLAGRTNGVQESRETLEWALNNVALASPLFRSGLNAALMNPEPIATATPLTLEQAEEILQRNVGKNSTYPGDPQSMLARALQQNMASWLNLGSGKVGPTTVVQLNVTGGLFEGTLMEALLEAQDIILNATGPDDPALERAKDIGDQINNGLLGEDAASSVCSDYVQVIPPDKQPPKHKDMPKAPRPEMPEEVTPAPTPDPATCNLRTNTYGVEVTNNPFYGIKFEYQSGTEIKGGELDEFKFTVTAEQAAAMTSVQMEAKAANYVGVVTLEADFTSPIGTGEPVKDADGYFGFYFGGATDNGNGTVTLTFMVQNFTDRGLSHATVGLPDGVVPSTPTGNYQSQVCQE